MDGLKGFIYKPQCYCKTISTTTKEKLMIHSIRYLEHLKELELVKHKDLNVDNRWYYSGINKTTNQHFANVDKSTL